MENQTRDLHYFHVFAVLDRVNLSTFDDKIHHPDLTRIDFSDIMPSLEDQMIMMHYFSVHIARTLQKYSPFISSLKSCIEHHIQHKYSVQMAKK